MTDPTTTTTIVPTSLLGSTESSTPTEAQYIPFGDWALDKEDRDPVQLRVDYADYMRQTRLESNLPMDVEIENNIQQGLYGSLVTADLLKDGDYDGFKDIIKKNIVEPSFEDKFALTISNLNYDDPDRDALSKFSSMDKVIKAGNPNGFTEESLARHAELKEAANNIILNRYNEAKTRAIDTNKIPFAVFEDDNGDRMFKTSDLATSMSLNEALKASRAAGVSLADAYVAQGELAIAEGSTVARYKINQISEMYESLSTLAKTDKSVKSTIEALGNRAAFQEFDSGDKGSYLANEFGEALGLGVSKVIGLFSDEASKKVDADYNAKKEIDSQVDRDISYFRDTITKKLEDSGAFEKGSLNPEDVDRLIKEVAISNASQNSKFVLHDEEGEYQKNIRKTSLGTTVMHPAALMNENLFNKTLEARPDITGNDRKKLEGERLVALTDNYNNADKVFQRTGSEDKWNLAKIDGRLKGKANHEILNDFLKDDENYNNFAERTKGLGMSILTGFGSPVLGVLTAAGADWSAEMLRDIAQDNSDRREVAEMFGQKMGFGQDIAESLAPLVVDMAATALLSTVTAPVAGMGGVAYLAAKQGARLTMKGMMKGLTKGAFRIGAKETAETASKRILADGLIKESVKKVTGEGALAAIKGYNSLVAQRIGTSAASFIPAATRTGASTYGSVSLALKKKQQELGLTDEQIHDRSLGAALTSGMVTGVITAAFGSFGKAGVEDAMLRGLTFKQSKNLLGSLANVKNLSDTKFKEAVTKQLSATIKKLEKSSKTGFLKDAVDEAQEEGLDQLLNSFVEDAATDQDTPFLERLKQTMYAAAMGATLGGGITLTKGAWNKVNPFKNQAAVLQEGISLQQKFISDVTQRLNDSGSPITAQAVGRILTQQARARQAPISAPAPAATTPADTATTTPAVTADTAATTPADTATTTPADTTPAVTAATIPADTAATIPADTAATIPADTAATIPADTAATTPAVTTATTTPPIEAAPVEVIPVAPITLTPEAEAAIAERESLITSLSVPLVGRKAIGKKANAKIEKAKKEIGYIKETGNAKVPRSLPKPVAPVATPAFTPPVVPSETPSLEQPSDITDVNELFVRISETPQEQADQIISNAVAQLENNQEVPLVATIGSTTISSTFPQEPITIISQPSPSAQKAAAVAEIDTDEAASNTASHVASFDPDADVDESSRKQQRKKNKSKSKKERTAPITQALPTDTPLSSFDTSPFRKGDELTPQEEAEADAVSKLAVKGFPLRFGNALKYGTVTAKNLVSKSEYLARLVYAFYPAFKIGEGEVAYTQNASRVSTYFDPIKNETVKGTIKMPLDRQDRGIFNNDPIVVTEMLAHGIPVFIKPSVDRNTINKSFVIKNNYVVDVRKPSLDGKSMESAVTRITETTDISADNSLYQAYSRIPFYPEGVEAKLMPTGTKSVNQRTGYGEGLATTMGELMYNVGAFTSNDKAVDALLSSTAINRGDLDEDFKDNAVTAAKIEFLMLANLHELRVDILSSGKLTTPEVGSNNVTLLPKKQNGAIKALQSRLKGNLDVEGMAKVLSPLLSKRPKKSATNTSIVLQFIDEQVINNKDLTGGFMPSFITVLRRTADRYYEQQIVRKVNERNRAMVSLDESRPTGVLQDPDVAFEDQANSMIDNIDAEQLKNSSISLGGANPNFSISEQAFHLTIKDTITEAVDAIDNDADLRDSLEELAFTSVYPNPDGGTAAHVKGLRSRDLMARIGDWMTLGNHANRPDVLSFIQDLERGGAPAGMQLKNALKLSAIAGRIDGNPLEDPAYIAEVQRLLVPTFGEAATKGRASNIVKTIDRAVRTRFSRAVVNNANKGLFRQQNAADIARLGLASGDPESVVKALTEISKSSNNPAHKLVAELLLEDPAFIRRVKFSIGSSQTPIAGEYARHVDGNHSVFLNTEQGNGLGLENVLLEEYVHAFLSDTMTQPLELLSDKQRSARLRLEGLYQLAQKAYAQQKTEQGEAGYNASLETGLENIDEFVANFLLDPTFQQFIKTLPVQEGQRGFFQRIIEAMVSLFRKVSAKENTAYAQALKDIVDLSKTTIRATAVPFSMRVASDVTRAANDLAEVTNTPRLSTSTATPTIDAAAPVATDTTEEATADETETTASDRADRDKTEASIEETIASGSKKLPTEKQKSQFVQLMRWLNTRIPAGTQVIRDETIEGAAEAEGDVIRINPAILMSQVYELDPLAQRSILDSILNEELGHHASFGSLTQGEVDSIVDSLSNSAFEEIARAYHINNPQNVADVLAKLASSDPTVVRQQQRVLVEEKLRMRLQQVTRGYTTEDDVAFWTSKPSLLRILKRYIGGALNSYLNRKKLGMGSGAMDAAVFAMMQEMQAINMGFAKTNAYRALDTNSPAEAIAEYNRILNFNILDETDALYEAQDRMAALATSGLPLATFAGLMQQAGLRVINGNQIVDDDEAAAVAPTKEAPTTPVQGDLDFTAGSTPTPAARWTAPAARWTAPPDRPELFSVSYTLSLQDLENTLRLNRGIDSALNLYFAGAASDAYYDDIVDELEVFDTLVVSSLRGRPVQEFQAVELLSTYDPDSSTFDLVPYTTDGQIDDVKAKAIIEAIILIEKMKVLGLDPSTPIPVTFRYDYAEYTPDSVIAEEAAARANGSMTAPMALLGGGTDLETPPDLVVDGLPLSFDPDMESTNLDIEAILRELNLGVAKVIENIDRQALEDTIKALRIEYGDRLFQFKVVSMGKNEYTVSAYEKVNKNPWVTNKQTAVVSVSLDIKNENNIHIGWMGRDGGTTEEAAKIPFAATLMNALVSNNSAIKALGIETLAGGAGSNFLQRSFKIGYLDSLNIDQSISGVVELLFPTVKDQSKYNIKLSESMNGYYTWPSMGFQMSRANQLDGFTKGSALDRKIRRAQGDIENQIRALQDSILYSAQGQRLSDDLKRKLNEHSVNFIEQSKIQIASELNEFVDAATTPDGKLDLYHAIHVNPKGNRAANLWRRYGQSMDVTFDTQKGSKDLKNYVTRMFSPAVRTARIEDIDVIMKSYRAATKDENITPDELQEIKDEHNDRAFEAGVPFKLFTSFGQSSSASSDLSNIDFSAVVELLEMPMFEYGAYKAQKGWLNIFRGDMSTPVKRLFEQREEFKRAASQLVISYKEKMDKLVINTYGDKASADWDLLAKAQGYIDGNLVSDAAYEAMENAYNAELERIANDQTLTPADQRTQRAAARQQRDQDIEAAESSAIAQVTIERDAALNQLQSLNSDLAVHIVSMRTQLIQPIQQKLIAAGIDPNIGLKIDKTGGIYITRAYAMFNDPTYAERVRTEPHYQAVRDAAMSFFTTKLFDMSFSEAKAQKLSDIDATNIANLAVQKANQKAPAGSSYGSLAMEAFLSSYDQKQSPSPQTTKGLKEIMNNLKRRKDLPKELRDLLGEYGAKNGTDLIVRTFSSVAMVAAQQTFLNNLAKTGTKQGFMVDAKTYAANPSQYPDYVPMRSGGSTKNDPLAHMYAPKDIVDSLGAALEARVTQQSTTAEEAVSAISLVARNLTGKAMVAKTLGSVGFYLRNALGNLLFFAPAQGFIRADKIAVRTGVFSYMQLKDPNRINAAMAELTGLGIIGDEIQPAMLKALLSGAASKDSMLASLDKFTAELPVVGTVRKGMEWLENKASTLSGAIDAAYKIEYFQHELDTLLEARANDPSGKLTGMSDYDLKRMAAVKVKMTAQSASQAPDFVKALNNSTFGLMFAPFIRFKAEVPRIVINTYKLGWEEVNSGNPVLVARGKKRLGAMTGVLGVFSAVIPAVVSALFGGVRDEEDEALRKSMPEYLRSHSFLFYRDSKNDLISLDLTYVNPFSLLVDPFMRALPYLKNGEVGNAASTLTKGLFFSTYLDDQILAGNLANVIENKDSTTNQNIYIEGVDGVFEAMTKQAAYVFKKTYTPRIVQDVMNSVSAMDGNYVGERNSPLAQLFDGMKPVKTHPIDLVAQHRRFLYDHAERFSQLKREKYAMLRKQAMSPEEIDEIYDREFKGRRSLNQELLSAVRGFESLGIKPQDQYNTMKSAGIGKEKARLLFQGIMDRPDIEKDFAEKLIENQQTDRLEQLIKVRDRYNRYIFIDDIKTK